MKSVYVVTLYKGYNYGSALQCYALQQAIQMIGFKPYVIDTQYTGSKWKLQRFLRNFMYYVSCLNNSERRNAFQGVKENAKVAGIGISPQTKEKFDQFIDEKISVKRCNYDELRDIVDDNCAACISGSDQVWGTSVKYLNPIHFLTFAPENKRYSYAASFGSNAIPAWFVHEIKNYLEKYKRISVREDSALEILKGLGIDNGEVMIDPTLLLTAEEWSQFEKRPEGITSKFDFAYFLNKPSSIATNHICSERKRNIRGVICYEPFDNLNGTGIEKETISLSPEEFVWMIHHCERLYTDSFHGVAFAVLFHGDFYVYRREYVGVPDQSSRVNSILSHLRLTDHFINDTETNSNADYSHTDTVLSMDREKGYSYLREILMPD